MTTNNKDERTDVRDWVIRFPIQVPIKIKT